MSKKTLYHIIEWGIALAACGWLVYKMATYDDYPALWETLRGMDFAHVCALLVCVALMPVNMTLEAWRWRTLVPMSWREAHRQVYYSKLAGLITPWRLGEYPARALLMTEEKISNRDLWSRILSMGAVGSATMTAAIVLAGLVALAWGSMDMLGDSYRLWVMAVLAALMVALALTPRLLCRWADVSYWLIAVSLAQSLVRLLCWCVQLYLILWALSPSAFHLSTPTLPFALPIYYLLVTVTPNVPIAEVGVRGAWAIAVFGSMNAAFAGVLLWGINTLLPCLVWPFLRKNE